MKSGERVLGFSIGNSTLRHGILEGDRVLGSSSTTCAALASGAFPLAPVVARYRPQGAVLASVRDDYQDLLERQLRGVGLPFVVARRDFALPIRNLYDDPSEAGTDRLLALIAAYRRSRGAGAVVVDFGTATTVSVVSPVCEFLGGTITAGAGTLARGLSMAAPRLPSVRVGDKDGADDLPGDEGVLLERVEEFVARGTRAALRTGVFWLVVGGVRTLVARVLESLEFSPRVYATGGEAPVFAGAIPEVDEVLPDLVLEGLAIAYNARGG